jgi:uncharacterized membrane protein YoaK (UPF0700 family)
MHSSGSSYLDRPAPPVLTTNMTRLTIDLAWFRKRAAPEELAKARKRASDTFPGVLRFIVGCAAGALLYTRFGLWALAMPLILSISAIPLGEFWSDAS